MPTIHVDREYFFNLLGKTMDLKELEKLCFEFGIEMEEEKPQEEEKKDDKKGAKKQKAPAKGEESKKGDEKKDKKKKGAANQPLPKLVFEVAANRYDLLCAEGVAEALANYLEMRKPPQYKLVTPEKMEKMTVTKATGQIRPFVVGAVLRNFKFTKGIYESFIDLQDKLHHNICRKRTLVAIGTHDLDSVKGPFVYDAKKPEDIVFKPLDFGKKPFADKDQPPTQETQLPPPTEMNARQVLDYFRNHQQLREYLHIIENSEVYPVIYDSNGVVLSLPPIINGEHSKINENTKNIFIESTATDYTRALVVLNIMVTMFSRYCAEPFTFEPVEIVYEKDGSSKVTPDVTVRQVETELHYVERLTGIKFTTDEVNKLLGRMGIESKTIAENKVSASVPITRSDILHPCDIAEDIAIAYGYNNLEFKLPKATTTGKQLTLNKLTDMIRHEIAQAGYSECLNFVLCSLDEIGAFLNKPEEVEKAVKISNAKTQEFQCGRTSLIPGILKTLSHNKSQPLPVKLFETGDIVFKSDNEAGAKNQRRIVALYTNKNTSGLEHIHGLLDYIMSKLGIPFNPKVGYTIKESNDPSFFPGRQAEVSLKGTKIGIMGIVHPEVNKKFKISTPVSVLELDAEQIIFQGFFEGQ